MTTSHDKPRQLPFVARERCQVRGMLFRSSKCIQIPFPPAVKKSCCLAQHINRSNPGQKEAATLFQATKYTVLPAAPAAEEATSQPLQGLVGSDAPTNSKFPTREKRHHLFPIPTAPHASKLRQLLQQLSSKPKHRTKLLRRCCDQLPQTTNSPRSRLHNGSAAVSRDSAGPEAAEGCLDLAVYVRNCSSRCRTRRIKRSHS